MRPPVFRVQNHGGQVRLATFTPTTQLPMNDYFSEALGIDPDDYPGESDEDEQEQEERHPSLSAEERNS